MTKPTSRFAAAVLTTLIIVVGVSALDHLPAGVRTQIEQERSALALAKSQVRAAQDSVAREAQAEPALFDGLAASRQWPSRFQQASGVLDSAARDMDELSRLEQKGHHSDLQRVSALIVHEGGLRRSAVSEASAIENEASHLVERKQRVADEVAEMERSYQAIHNFDFRPLTDKVQRAQSDWPEKKADLDTRLASVTAIVTHSDSLWQSTETARRQVKSGAVDGLDFGALFTAADELKTSAASLPGRSSELVSLTGQLYESWDRVLTDMETQGFLSHRAYRQRIRTVRMHQGATDVDEKWVDVSPSTYDAMRHDLGMAIEHKPAGKYDSEAERVAQPAGFAYLAPPSQGSNQYGYWEHRNGQSFWVFYGQYALMRDLLFNRSYRPLDRYEWEDYRSAQNRGQTYYGRDAEAGGAPKYGSNGTATEQRYGGSAYERNGGFRNSPYASRPGSFRGSPYASRSAGEPHIRPTPRSAPRRFGRH